MSTILKFETCESEDILKRFNQLSEDELIDVLGPFQPVQEIGDFFEMITRLIGGTTFECIIWSPK